MGWFMLFSSQEVLGSWSLKAPQETAEKRTGDPGAEARRLSAGSEQLHLWEREDAEAEGAVTERALSEREAAD